MDAPGSVELEEAELARLRRRAYGPDADIAGDAVAQARLSELEAAQRRELTPVVDAGARGSAAVSESVLVPQPVDGARSAATSVLHPVDGEEFAEHGPAGGSVTGQHPAEGSIGDSNRIDGPPVDRWRRRRRWLVILGGAIAALVLIAALLAWISQPRADESTPVPTDRHVDGTLDLLGLRADELRQYEDFNGVDVWSGESRFGMVCLLVVLDDREGTSAEGCSPERLETTAEVEWFQNEGLTRYVLKGDHVEVHTYVSKG